MAMTHGVCKGDGMTDETHEDWTEIAPGVHLPPGFRKVTDENPLLTPEEQATSTALHAAFDLLRDPDNDNVWNGLPEQLQQELTTALYRQAHASGAKVGQWHRMVGSNVAMAYYHGGVAYQQTLAQHRHHAEPERHSAAFFDGFTSTYFVDVTDQQKSGPYA